MRWHHGATKNNAGISSKSTHDRSYSEVEKVATDNERITLKAPRMSIEHWAKIGKCAEENPDLTYSLIKEILVGIEELERGEKSEYKFG